MKTREISGKRLSDDGIEKLHIDISFGNAFVLETILRHHKNRFTVAQIHNDLERSATTMSMETVSSILKYFLSKGLIEEDRSDVLIADKSNVTYSMAIEITNITPYDR